MTGKDRSCSIDAKEGRLPNTKENAEKCKCPMCPTFNDCMNGKNERLYCARGPTGCKFARLGCVCGECEVAIKFGLASNYYCGTGPAKF